MPFVGGDTLQHDYPHHEFNSGLLGPHGTTRTGEHKAIASTELDLEVPCGGCPCQEKECQGCQRGPNSYMTWDFAHQEKSIRTSDFQCLHAPSTTLSRPSFSENIIVVSCSPVLTVCRTFRLA